MARKVSRFQKNVVLHKGEGGAGREQATLATVQVSGLELTGDLGKKRQGYGREQKPCPRKLRGNRSDEHSMAVQKAVARKSRGDVANLEIMAGMAFFKDGRNAVCVGAKDKGKHTRSQEGEE